MATASDPAVAPIAERLAIAAELVRCLTTVEEDKLDRGFLSLLTDVGRSDLMALLQEARVLLRG